LGGIPPCPSVPPERSGGGQFRSKKVRAKVNISAPNDTSDFESEREPRAEGAGMGKNCRRVATKWLGEETEKWADLFLVSYPNNFYQF